MKKFKKIFAVCALSSFAAVASACSGSASDIRAINTRWNLDLPTSMECVYSYDNVGWFGDGEYYYVFNAEEGQLPVNFMLMTDGQAEAVTSLYSSLFGAVDSAYYINTDNGLLVHYGSENDGNDYIYLIYDGSLSRLTVMEYHS